MFPVRIVTVPEQKTEQPTNNALLVTEQDK